MTYIQHQVHHELAHAVHAERREHEDRRRRAAGAGSRAASPTGRSSGRFSTSSITLPMYRLAMSPHTRSARCLEEQGPGLEAVLLERREQDRRGRRGRQAERQQRHEHAGERGVVGRLGPGHALDGALAELLLVLATAAARARRRGTSGSRRRRRASRRTGSRARCRAATAATSAGQSSRVIQTTPADRDDLSSFAAQPRGDVERLADREQPDRDQTTSMPSRAAGRRT